MTEKFINRNHGTYWRVACSSEWHKQQPWSFDGNPMPYIGIRRSNNGIALRTLGPIALISITIPKREA